MLEQLQGDTQAAAIGIPSYTWKQDTLRTEMLWTLLAIDCFLLAIDCFCLQAMDDEDRVQQTLGGCQPTLVALAWTSKCRAWILHQQTDGAYQHVP